jgi:hypothetical protein
MSRPAQRAAFTAPWQPYGKKIGEGAGAERPTMMYFIELIRFLPGRAEPEVLSRIHHADRDPEGNLCLSAHSRLKSLGVELGEVRKFSTWQPRMEQC